MALPPEPLADVLPRATLVVLGEVLEVISQGPLPPANDAMPGRTSTGHQVRSQVVKLAITRVLSGKSPGATLEVEKPLAGYALKAGNKGPFLLDGTSPRPVILGRYGPDSYRLEAIELALKASPGVRK